MQQVESCATRGSGQERLFRGDAARPAARIEPEFDEFDVRCPLFLSQRGGGIGSREERQPKIVPRREEGGDEPPGVDLTTAGLGRDEVEQVEADAHQSSESWPLVEQRSKC